MVPDKKLSVNIQPSRRISLNVDSVILEFEHFALFSSWIDMQHGLYYNSKNIPYNFNLLYRASRDGIKTSEFHKRCDNKGATIVIVKVEGTDSIVGGYNPLDWDTSESYKATNDSFVFSFTNKNDINTATVSHVNSFNHAIYCYSN